MFFNISLNIARVVFKQNDVYFFKNCLSKAKFHKSSALGCLMEFFDDKDNWNEEKVKVGRPYAMEELRIKSNSDLHKLWYVLLKERNMLMTMEGEYNYEARLFPSPERIFKVEESMENLLDVVAERDRAYHTLETGEDVAPPEYQTEDLFGRMHTRRASEHYAPVHLNSSFRSFYDFHGEWQLKYLIRYREKMHRRLWYRRLEARRRLAEMKRVYRHRRDLDLSELEQEAQEGDPQDDFEPVLHKQIN